MATDWSIPRLVVSELTLSASNRPGRRFREMAFIQPLIRTKSSVLDMLFAQRHRKNVDDPDRCWSEGQGDYPAIYVRFNCKCSRRATLIAADIRADALNLDDGLKAKQCAIISFR